MASHFFSYPRQHPNISPHSLSLEGSHPPLPVSPQGWSKKKKKKVHKMLTFLLVKGGRREVILKSKSGGAITKERNKISKTHLG